MQAVLSVVHLIVVFLLVGVILLQRSEGGGFTSDAGMSGGMMSSRSVANFLTRITAFLATAFFVLSIVLAIFALNGQNSLLGDSIADGDDRANNVQELLGVPTQKDTQQEVPKSQ